MSHLSRFAALLGCVLTAVTAAAATTVTLQEGVSAYSGTTDTYLQSASPTSNFGSSTQITVGNTNAILLRFPIFASEGGPVPSGATIVSATLSIYKYSGVDAVFDAKRLLRAWQEMQASWNNAASGAPWDSGGAQSAGTDATATADGQGSIGWGAVWLEINVTSGVQAITGGAPNYGWRLGRLSGTSGAKYFHSRNYSNPSLRPKLSVTYETVPPSAPTGLNAAPLGSGQVQLIWSDSSSEESGFKVERKIGIGGTYAEIGIAGANATAYSDSTGLAAATTYYYRVRATNSVGDSSYSNEAMATTGPIANATGGVVEYTYDAFGNLVQTNAGGVVTTLLYDRRGRKIAMSDPDMGNWTYSYDALGELVSQTDAKSQTTTISYDKLGRMTNRTELDLVSNWTYDSCTKGVGKLCLVNSDNGFQRTVAYDGLGRAASLSTQIDTSYTVTTTYDSAGRVEVVNYPTGFATKNVYNSYGYLAEVRNSADNSLFWQAQSQSAAGAVTQELLGNALTVSRGYDAIDRLTNVSATGSGGTAESLTYAYDAIGNVSQRVDAVMGVTENFFYDSLNRLLASSGPGLISRSFDYDAIGNIIYKSDVGSYGYAAVGSVRPHAVSSVSNGGAPNSISATYGYDPNGSLISASGTIYPASGSVTFSRTLSYTSFNMPATVNQVQGGNSYGYTYTYSADHERLRLVTVRPDDTLTSIYLHPDGKGRLLYEKETRQSDGRIEHKHYVNAGGALVGAFVTKSSYGQSDGPQMRYYHRDHLGSIAVITNPSGAVLERLGYEVFGERRNANGMPQDRSSPLFAVTTERGFTGHEHLDELNLIHMNGRIYDPALGRFITSDPLITGATDLQSYNRYSYVNNNPLRYTDPTGYKKKGNLLGMVVAIVVAYYTGYYDYGITASSCGTTSIGLFGASSYGYAGGWAMFGNAVVAGAAAGGISTGSWEGVVSGAFGGALFLGAGNLGEFYGLAEGGMEMTTLHAAAGCVASAASGGKCGSGALSAGFAQAASPSLPGDPRSMTRLVARAVVGGTASALGGGKFENGAATAAFAYLFNDLGHVMRAEARATRSPLAGFHEYENWSPCPLPNCTEAEVAAELSKRPAPGSRSGDRTSIPILGDVRHIDGPGHVLNLTVDGQHSLAPGAVGRGVQTRNGVVGISTYGVGWGVTPAANEVLAPPMWRQLDSIIYRRVEQNRLK